MIRLLVQDLNEGFWNISKKGNKLGSKLDQVLDIIFAPHNSLDKVCTEDVTLTVVQVRKEIDSFCALRINVRFLV